MPEARHCEGVGGIAWGPPIVIESSLGDGACVYVYLRVVTGDSG
jgi:hypothetical protein